MQLLLLGTGALLLATLVPVALTWVVLRVLGRRPARFWRRTLAVHGALALVHLFVTVPAALGWLGSRMVHTRGDESAWAGPRLDEAGEWQIQSRSSLAAGHAEAPASAPGGTASAPAVAVVWLTASDGVRLRAFLVPATRVEPRCTAVLVHGLFRGGMELEPVGAMFRELGAEVMLLELRNHGGSGRAPATFGLGESRDVIAAVEWLRRRRELGGRPVVLFGVSLGTVAVALAAPRLPDLAGVVLDAPITDVLGTAHRMLAHSERRGMAMPQPFRTLVLASLELWSGFSFDDVRPRAALLGLPPDVPVLLVGGGDDDRAPPGEVEALSADLPTRPELKKLWIRPGSDHGSVWVDDPEAYRRHLRAFLELVDRARGRQR